MTIYQLIQASQAHTDADWILDDHEIGQVRFIVSVLLLSQYIFHIGYHRGVHRIRANSGYE
jgi:hypothetical protein